MSKVDQFGAYMQHWVANSGQGPKDFTKLDALSKGVDADGNGEITDEEIDANKAAIEDALEMKLTVSDMQRIKSQLAEYPQQLQIHISGSVGKGQKNAAAADVEQVRTALTLLDVKFQGTGDLGGDIERFQLSKGFRKADGVIDPGKTTERLINQSLAQDYVEREQRFLRVAGLPNMPH